MHANRLLVLLPDTKHITGAMLSSRQFLSAMRQVAPESSLVVLSLDKAVTWYRCINSHATFRSNSMWSRISRNIRYTIKVIHYGLTERPRIAFCPVEPLAPVCVLLGYLLGIEYVLFSRDAVWKKKSFLLKRAFTKASWVVANSNYTRSKVLEWLPLNPERVAVLHPPVESNRFYPSDKPDDLVKQYGLDDYRTLLSVGRLASSELDAKGYEKVIKALATVIRKIPNIKYLIVGSGDGHSYLQALSNNYNLQDQVLLVGSVPNSRLRDYYNICDLFVLPSKDEGFGRVYTEALTCGKPVIGGAAKGSFDALLNGKLGMLVDPDDVEGLADAIINMIEGNVEPHLLDPNYLRETVLAHYGFERFTERVGELLETVLGENLK